MWIGVYPYEYMDNLEKKSETLLEKEYFCSRWNMEDISNADCMHTKRVGQDCVNEKFSFMPWYVCSKQYIIVRSCIWELLKYAS